MRTLCTIPIDEWRKMEAERDALKQRVDDQAVAMTTALEWIEGCEQLGLVAIKRITAVLAKALRKGGE